MNEAPVGVQVIKASNNQLDQFVKFPFWQRLQLWFHIVVIFYFFSWWYLSSAYAGALRVPLASCLCAQISVVSVVWQHLADVSTYACPPPSPPSGPVRSGIDPNKPSDSGRGPAGTHQKSLLFNDNLLWLWFPRRRSRWPFVCGTFSSWRGRGCSLPWLSPSWRYTKVSSTWHYDRNAWSDPEVGI